MTRILHAIHDFLPRHRAGSELYALSLAREQSRRGAWPTVLSAEYDPSRRHGEISWRVYDEIPVVEVVNNWRFSSFEESYQSAYVDNRLGHVLRAVQPHVVHVHNLLNLSFNLPALAKRSGAAVVATLHDFTLVCPSGGQRVHVAGEHVCEVIEPERCARCFAESPFGAQLHVGGVRSAAAASLLTSAGAALRARAPAVFARAWRLRPRPAISARDITRRLDALEHVFEAVDRFVAPSRALADDLVRFGLPSEKVQVGDYGFDPLPRREKVPSTRLRVGFVGTIAWHKGLHVLLDAVARLPQDALEVVIHGDPECFPQYGRRLRDTAARLPSVRWMGAFDEQAAADVFAGLDVLVVPSLWPENSPLVIHEAFMAGVPVIASRMGGIPELVEHGVSGLLYDPTSADALGSCLTALLNDRDLLARLREGAPPVRTIGDDAAGWDRIYQTCTTSASCC